MNNNKMTQLYKHTQIHKQKYSGFTLIELLISMLIGAMILTGVVQVFASTKNSSKALQAESEIQENARFAFSVITSIVQEAGDFGCQAANPLSTKSLVNTADATFKPGRVIEGWEATGSSYGDTYTAEVGSDMVDLSSSHWVTSDNAQKDTGTLAKQNSDVFKIWYTKKQRTALTSIAGNVLQFSPIDLETGTILAINDCQTLLFAQTCSCEDSTCADSDTEADIDPGSCSSPGNTAFNLTKLNIPTTEIGILDSALFFVGKRNDDANNIPSLFIRRLGNDATLDSKEEILEGVESMQVLYGEDTNNNKSPNYYVSADDVSNWDNVVSLKISLLLRSYKNNIFSSAQSIAFNGTNISVADSDRYLRRVFTSVISIRNRNIGY